MLNRRNVMIDQDNWEAFEILKEIEKPINKEISISKLLNKAMEVFIKNKMSENLLFKMRMVSNVMNQKEEVELFEELSKLSSEDKKVSRKIELWTNFLGDHDLRKI